MLFESDWSVRHRHTLPPAIQTFELSPPFFLDYSANLSILLTEGEENNCDSLSNGERSGKSTNGELVLEGTELSFKPGIS